MMHSNSYRYSLAREKEYKWRECPQCHEKELTLYLDNYTGLPINQICGRCNRENNCGYDYNPWNFYRDNGEQGTNIMMPLTKPHKMPLKRVHPDELKATLAEYDKNNLYMYAAARYGRELVDQAFGNYYIGTSHEPWANGTTFWYINSNGIIVNGKTMLYNPVDGHRVKSPKSCIVYKHSTADGYQTDCLFGEHLLHNYKSDAPVFVVESEKTAVLMSMYVPDRIWLATAGCGNLTKKRCQALFGLTVVVFPDAQHYDDWEKKAYELKGYCKSITVSDYILDKATDEQYESDADIFDLFEDVSVESVRERVALKRLKENASNGHTDSLTEAATETATHDDYSVPQNPVLASMISTNPFLEVLCEKFHLILE